MFLTKVLDQEGNEIQLDIKLDLIGSVVVELDENENLDGFSSGDIITVVIHGRPGMFGTPVYANIDLEVFQGPYSGSKVLTVKEIRGAR